MNIMHVIILELILFFIFEEIVEKSSAKINYIQDEWVNEKSKLNLTSEKQ